MKIAKKGSGVTTVHYPEVLDTAICFGWIDAVRRPLDDTYFLQRFTPRGPRSKWSQVNREKALALTARGADAPRRARPGPGGPGRRPLGGGLRAPEPGLDPRRLPERPSTPSRRAKEFFATLKGQQRYAFLYRLHNVKTQKARDRRIANYIELLREGRTLN